MVGRTGCALAQHEPSPARHPSKHLADQSHLTPCTERVDSASRRRYQRTVQQWLQVLLPYIAEENADEEPEVQVRPDTEGAAASTAKDAIFGNRREVRTFFA